MLSVEICIGSSCHLKGSHGVIETLQRLVAQNGLETRVDMRGVFCLGQCMKGVCVRLNGGEVYSVSPGTAEAFFKETILPNA